MRTIRDGKGQELATILEIEDYANGDGSQFFTEPEESLQVGSLLFQERGEVLPHVHREKDVGVAYPIVEMILILRGVAVLDVYDEEEVKVESCVVRTGMLLLLKRGGHGYTFPNGAVKMLDVRCGPYVDKKTDKKMIKRSKKVEIGT